MICVVDASVAVKWFTHGDWASREDHLESAVDLLLACRSGAVDFYQPPHFLAEVAAVLARITPNTATQCVQDIAAMSITWAAPTVAIQRAIALATQLDHHLFDTLYHALALESPGTHFITADRRYFDKARHLGQIIWLPNMATSIAKA
jgi:predicted nucleic acid-binding protein